LNGPRIPEWAILQVSMTEHNRSVCEVSLRHRAVNEQNPARYKWREAGTVSSRTGLKSQDRSGQT